MAHLIKLGLFWLLLSGQVIAQQYSPFIKEDAIWFVHSMDEFGTEEYCSFEFGKDTLINSIAYKELLQSELQKNQMFSFAKVSQSSLGYIREDTSNKKVYFLKSESYKWGMSNCEVGEEFLLYDFDVSLGDTLQHCNSQIDPNFPLIINSIATEYLFREERSIFCFDVYCETGRYIEGIGNTEGLFVDLTNLFRTADHFVELIEYCEEKSDCEFSTSLENLDSDSEIIVYPNPVSSVLNIRGENTSKINCTIYNIYGEKILDTYIANKLDVSDLSSGIYFLYIHLGNAVRVIKFFKID